MTATTSSAQNFFGQFVDTFEEVVVPDAGDDNASHDAWTRGGRTHRRGRTVFDRFFRAMEKVNLPLAESSDSLASALSVSSFRSSQDDLSGNGNNGSSSNNVFSAEMFLEAVETLTLRDQFGSTNSLASQDFLASVPVSTAMAAAAPSTAVTNPQTAIQVFFRALEQFLIAKPEEGDDEEFPKFC